MLVASSVSIPENGDFLYLSNKPIVIWFPIVSNQSLNIKLERSLNYFSQGQQTEYNKGGPVLKFEATHIVLYLFLPDCNFQGPAF